MTNNNDYYPGIAEDCPCLSTSCKLWGKCRECIKVHRDLGNLVPYCMQLILKEAVANLAGLIECELVGIKK